MGRDVVVVQRKLGAPVTGSYDETTAAYVRGLQKVTGLEVTGMVNEKTAQHIGERAREGQTPEWFTRDIRLWDEGEDVRAAREALGLGATDNRWDPDAESAARRWQSANDKPLTGEVDHDMAVAIAIE